MNIVSHKFQPFKNSGADTAAEKNPNARPPLVRPTLKQAQGMVADDDQAI
jgi:hypothetical protein